MSDTDPMAAIEDHALLSDCRTAALVDHEGTIDWLCLPRYDSPSVLGALLGEREHGCWELRPDDDGATATRRYDGDTFVLVTRWETADGVAEVHDLLPIGERPTVIRRVVGVSGTVAFATRLLMRFDYARALPWVRQVGSEDAPALRAVAGPDALLVRGTRLTSSDHVHEGAFTVAEGEHLDLTMQWFQPWQDQPGPVDVDRELARTARWWGEWADQIDATGPYRDLVARSMLVLRALTHADTGGIVAAATTSLPEDFGGSRNWDDRYVWLRDASLTLEAMIVHGFLDVAHHWRTWLLRAVAGDPSQVQIMYGLSGERDLLEREIGSLPGYQGAAPVRVGNGAAHQFQADVIGEVMVALDAARTAGLPESDWSWPLQRALVGYVVEHIDRPDHGIWEIRGPEQHFTHSRVMVWAALDRAVRAVREHGLPSDDVETWERHRDRVRAEIEEHGYDAVRGHFVQHSGTTEVDASLLLLPQVGFCAVDDPRMLGTVAEIERTLMRDGLVMRYRTASGVDGLAGDEHPFLACSFWLVEQYADSGRRDDARTLMERLCGLVNDVGLLSEEYDVGASRQAGNLPQALSHLALVQAADALEGRSARCAQLTDHRKARRNREAVRS